MTHDHCANCSCEVAQWSVFENGIRTGGVAKPGKIFFQTISNACTRHGTHFLQTGLGYFEGVLFPVIAVEQFE